MSFVKDRIQNLPSHSSGLPRSQEEYLQLLERVQQEARRQKAHARAWALAKQQGVAPIRNIEDLKGDFWPEEESADEFLSWLRDLRQGDKPRSVPE
jgi:hypothetical protein